MNIQDLKDIFDLAIYNRFRMGKEIAAELNPTANVEQLIALTNRYLLENKLPD